MAQKDPTVPARRLEEGERVVVHLRRKRLENVLMVPLYLSLGLVAVASYLDWAWGTRMAAFTAFILLAVPVGIVINSHHWLTDRRVLRNVVGVWTSFPLEGAVPRATKGLLRDDVRFEDASGAPLVLVRSVDNAAEVLSAHAGIGQPAPAPPPEEPAPS
jgi:hypothetical protein